MKRKPAPGAKRGVSKTPTFSEAQLREANVYRVLAAEGEAARAREENELLRFRIESLERTQDKLRTALAETAERADRYMRLIHV